MDTKSLRLLSRFSAPPNHFGYCGTNSASRAFTRCITKGECDGVEPEVGHFKGLYPYLQTIADVTGKHYLDYSVIEAYWLGNNLLTHFKPDHYQILLKHLKDQGLPDFFINEVASNQPKAFIPLHLFNVIHIGVGRITGSVETNLENINHCMIRWGKITKIDLTTHQLTAKLKTLKIKHKSPTIYDLQSTIYDLDYNPAFLKPKLGDTIAVHWKQATKILTPTETKNLSHWTTTLISNLN